MNKNWLKKLLGKEKDAERQKELEKHEEESWAVHSLESYQRALSEYEKLVRRASIDREPNSSKSVDRAEKSSLRDREVGQTIKKLPSLENFNPNPAPQQLRRPNRQTFVQTEAEYEQDEYWKDPNRLSESNMQNVETLNPSTKYRATMGWVEDQGIDENKSIVEEKESSSGAENIQVK